MRRLLTGSISVFVAACMAPNPAFDEASETSTMGRTDGPQSTSEISSDTEPVATSTTTATSSTTRTDDTTTTDAAPCAWPDQRPMTFEVAGLCTTWDPAHRGYLQRFGEGAWVFFECAENVCDTTCTPVHEMTFVPASVEPPIELDGQCVQLAFAQALDPRGDECETRWVQIRNEGTLRLAYAAYWGLPDVVDDLPFGSIESEAKCSCSVHDVACCDDDGGDPGPRLLRVNPLSGSPIEIPPGGSEIFSVQHAAGLVDYEIVNHRSVRTDCETPPVHEWLIRVAGP